MLEVTSCRVCFKPQLTWSDPGTAAAVQQDHNAGGQDLVEQEAELIITLNGCNQSQQVIRPGLLSRSAVLLDPAVIALLTKQGTGVNALSCSDGLSQKPQA